VSILRKLAGNLRGKRGEKGAELEKPLVL
jgi:hypothetical protein